MGFKNCFSYPCVSNSIKEILKYSLCTVHPGETGRDCYVQLSTPQSCALLHVAMHAKHTPLARTQLQLTEVL